MASNDVIVARYSWRPRHSHYPRLIYTAAVLQVARGLRWWFMALAVRHSRADNARVSWLSIPLSPSIVDRVSRIFRISKKKFFFKIVSKILFFVFYREKRDDRGFKSENKWRRIFLNVEEKFIGEVIREWNEFIRTNL